MKRLLLFLLAAPLCAQTTIPASFFNNDFASSSNVGVVTTNGCRVWSAASWRLTNPSSGSYSWTTFAAFLSACGYNRVQFTMANTPSYASNTSASGCNSGGGGNSGNGGCNPPSDIGSGDNYRKTYDAALATEWYSLDATHKHYYGPWNEPNHATYWAGTTAQLAQLACDDYTAIHANDPQAVVLSPEYVEDNVALQPPGYYLGLFMTAAQTLTGLSSGAASVCFDEAAFHYYPQRIYYNLGYYGTWTNPENNIADVAGIKTALTAHNVGSLPVDVTETNWGNWTDPILGTTGSTTLWESGFMIEDHLLLLNAGVSKVWYYQADGGFTSSACTAVMWGGLWNSTNSTICVQGTAYNWMLTLLTNGSYVGTPCSRSNDGTYICTFVRGDTGTHVDFIWNFAVGAYSQGTKTVSIATNYTAALNVDQSAATVTSNAVTLPTNGAPIIVERP